MAPFVEASWAQVDEELENIENALKRLELAIPERVPGSINLPIAFRIAGIVESIHAAAELVREWAARARGRS